MIFFIVLISVIDLASSLAPSLTPSLVSWVWSWSWSWSWYLCLYVFQLELSPHVMVVLAVLLTLPILALPTPLLLPPFTPLSPPPLSTVNITHRRKHRRRDRRW